MNKKLAQMFAVIFVLGACIFMGAESDRTNNIIVNQTTVTVEQGVCASKPIEIVDVHVLERTVEEPVISDAELNLLALLTMAEAEGESELGQRLVIDAVLNRVDHERYPDSITGVIYQSGQFTSMTNGRVDKCYVSEDICQLIRDELRNRTNSDVIYFCTGDYIGYGTPMFAEGGHFFSSYN